MSKELEAYYKLDNTCCLNSDKIEFNLVKEDEGDDRDCTDVYEMTDCLEEIEEALKKINTLRQEIKLNSFAFYDEIADRDRMCYQIIFKNGYKESISMELFHTLKGVLS